MHFKISLTSGEQRLKTKYLYISTTFQLFKWVMGSILKLVQVYISTEQITKRMADGGSWFLIIGVGGYRQIRGKVQIRHMILDDSCRN